MLDYMICHTNGCRASVMIKASLPLARGICLSLDIQCVQVYARCAQSTTGPGAPHIQIGPDGYVAIVAAIILCGDCFAKSQALLLRKQCIASRVAHFKSAPA